MLQFISGWLISFWNLFIYVNNSQYTIYILFIWDRKCLIKYSLTIYSLYFLWKAKNTFTIPLFYHTENFFLFCVRVSERTNLNKKTKIYSNNVYIFICWKYVYAEGSSSRWNRTEGSHSNNVGSASTK